MLSGIKLPQIAGFISALEYNGSDVKALYRRALAREHLDNVGPAFKDAKEALRLSPNDKLVLFAVAP